MLLLLKIKAAWDRKFRLDHGQSLNVSWEEGKLTKDYSDIIALLDMGAGQSQLQIDFLGKEFHRQPILFTVLDDILTTEYGYKQVYTTNEHRNSLIERFRKIIG